MTAYSKTKISVKIRTRRSMVCRLGSIEGTNDDERYTSES